MHDHFIIIYRKEIYHSGASLNYAGSKIFSINKMNEKNLKDCLIMNINNIIKIISNKLNNT